MSCVLSRSHVPIMTAAMPIPYASKRETQCSVNHRPRLSLQLRAITMLAGSSKAYAAPPNRPWICRGCYAAMNVWEEYAMPDVAHYVYADTSNSPARCLIHVGCSASEHIKHALRMALVPLCSRNSSSMQTQQDQEIGPADVRSETHARSLLATVFLNHRL